MQIIREQISGLFSLNTLLVKRYQYLEEHAKIQQTNKHLRRISASSR